MSLRYGLVDGSPWTLQAIGEALGVSAGRVGQIAKRSIRKLRPRKHATNIGSAMCTFYQYLVEVIRPGELGDLERLATFVQEDLAYLPVHTHLLPLLELFSTWASSIGQPFSDNYPAERMVALLREQQTRFRDDRWLKRFRAEFRAYLDAAAVWPGRSSMVRLPVSLGFEQEARSDDGGQVGMFESEKLGRSVHYVSQLEQQFLLRLEHSPDVVFYQERPFRIPYMLDGISRTYVPSVFFVYIDGRGLVAEIKSRHVFALAGNMWKWPVLREFCERQGYGMLVTDGRVGIKSFWDHAVPRAYSDSLLAALADGPLTWPQYSKLREQHSATWNDLIAIVLQRQLIWTMHPFRLQLPAQT